MKKVLNILVILIISMVPNISMANNYDTIRDLHVSTSEEDGTIAIGCTAYNEDGTIYGTAFGDGKYLENIIPADFVGIKGVSEKHEKHTVDFAIGSIPNKTEKHTEINVFEYLPKNQSLVIKWNNLSKNDITTIDVNISNSITGETIARGYNLDVNEIYVTAYNVQGIPLKIEVLNNGSQKGFIELTLSSAKNKSAIELKNDRIGSTEVTSKSSVKTTTYNTSTVPKNIDGNQGSFLIKHRVKGDDRGHRVPHSRFVSGTNNMSTVNMALYYYEMQISYIMNLRKGKSVNWNTSIGVGDYIDIKMSTNSNQGKATIDMIDAFY